MMLPTPDPKKAFGEVVRGPFPVPAGWTAVSRQSYRKRNGKITGLATVGRPCLKCGCDFTVRVPLAALEPGGRAGGLELRRCDGCRKAVRRVQEAPRTRQTAAERAAELARARKARWRARQKGQEAPQAVEGAQVAPPPAAAPAPVLRPQRCNFEGEGEDHGTVFNHLGDCPACTAGFLAADDDESVV